MKKNSTDQLKVEGKMNEKDAGIVGKMQALALIIVAVGASFAMVLAAIGFAG